jgi:hypothetical protein
MMGRYLDLLRNEVAGAKKAKEAKKPKQEAEAATPSETDGLDISLLSLFSPSQGEETARALPPDDRSESADAKAWRAIFEERAYRHQCIGRTRAEAERLAWGDLQGRWHIEHGERVPAYLCAGCRRPIGEGEVLDMIDGNRVHNNACLIRHGDRWRDAATRALEEVGVRLAKCRSR